MAVLQKLMLLYASPCEIASSSDNFCATSQFTMFYAEYFWPGWVEIPLLLPVGVGIMGSSAVCGAFPGADKKALLTAELFPLPTARKGGRQFTKRRYKS